MRDGISMPSRPNPLLSTLATVWLSSSLKARVTAFSES